MEILTALVVGGVIGWLASIVMRTRSQMGILADIAVGIVGSILGRWLFLVFGLMAYGTIGLIVVNMAGAMILIAILKALKVYR